MTARNRLVVVALASVISACGGAAIPAASPSPNAIASATPAASRSEAPSSQTVCPNSIEDGGACLGILGPGTYETSVFEVPLTYTVSDGWANYEDLPGNFLLVPPGGSLEGVNAGTSDFIGLYYSGAPAAASCDQVPESGIATTPEAMARWFAGLPGLETTEPEPVTVGGLTGLAMDLDIADGHTDGCPYQGFEGIPMVPLTIGIPPASLHHVVMQGITTRLILLGTPGGRNLTIEIADVGGDNLDDLTDVVYTMDFTETTQ